MTLINSGTLQRSISVASTPYLGVSTNWTVTPIVGPINYGFSVVILTSGFPAIFYSPSGGNNLTFLPATSIDGSTWGSSVLIYAAAILDNYISGLMINGFPAIAFADSSQLGYAIGNATGSTWTVVNGIATILSNTGISLSNLQSTNPTIAYVIGSENISVVNSSTTTGAALANWSAIASPLVGAGHFPYLSLMSDGYMGIISTATSVPFLNYSRSTTNTGTIYEIYGLRSIGISTYPQVTITGAVTPMANYNTSTSVYFTYTNIGNSRLIGDNSSTSYTINWHANIG